MIIIILGIAFCSMLIVTFFPESKSIKLRNFKCYKMHWHCKMLQPRNFDGCSVHAMCSHCGKNCMQDSQGNWF